MTMSRTLLILLLLLYAPATSLSAGDEVLKHTKWGMSPDEVLSIIPNGKLDGAYKGQYEQLMSHKINEYGGTSLITCAFVENRLVRIFYWVILPNSSIQTNIPIALKTKYGKPAKCNSIYGERKQLTCYYNSDTIIEYFENPLGISIHYIEKPHYLRTKKIFNRYSDESDKNFNDSF